MRTVSFHFCQSFASATLILGAMITGRRSKGTSAHCHSQAYTVYVPMLKFSVCFPAQHWLVLTPFRCSHEFIHKETTTSKEWTFFCCRRCLWRIPQCMSCCSLHSHPQFIRSLLLCRNWEGLTDILRRVNIQKYSIYSFHCQFLRKKEGVIFI